MNIELQRIVQELSDQYEQEYYDKFEATYDRQSQGDLAEQGTSGLDYDEQTIALW